MIDQDRQVMPVEQTDPQPDDRIKAHVRARRACSRLRALGDEQEIAALCLYKLKLGQERLPLRIVLLQTAQFHLQCADLRYISISGPQRGYLA